LENRSSNPRYRAEVRPYYPRRARAPEWEAKDFLGKSGKFFTVIRMWIYGATTEYPEVALHLSLSNGAGSAYSKITPQDLDNLISQLSEWRNQILGVMPKLETEAQIVKDSQDKILAMQKLIRMSQSEQEELEDIEYIPREVVNNARPD